jgi:phosphoribosylformimino-5-aminoimidazole carboxamide ribotide isomerase
MQAIPVIDIRNGVVVRAIAGRRADYQPLVSPLATTSAPLDVARGLLALHAFPAIYIADLDAIEGRADNRAAIEAIGQAFPAVDLWIDAGMRDCADMRQWLDLKNVSPVVGSESVDHMDAPRMLRDAARVVLSLDFRGETFLGPRSLLRSSELWPARVIVMTLERVGGAGGPDFSRLARIMSRAQGREIFAAGGVRDAHDLLTLRAAGAKGALIASSLHEGRLSAQDLALLERR